MRRLYLHIYLTLIASLAALTLLFWITREVFEGNRPPPWIELTATVIARALPPDQPAHEVKAVLDQLNLHARFPVSLYSDSGVLIAASGRPLPLPTSRSATHWIGRETVALRLADGRWIVARTHPHHPWHLIAGLGLMGLLIAAASYPFVRRLTGRLERLRGRVEALGSGNLKARVDVEGHDEIAALARSFNRAAEQIDSLVQSQRDLLANASHELRSPLTRIGLAFELLAESSRPELRDQVQRDIAELDELIGELLLASRLQALVQVERPEPIDLLALAASEAAHVGAHVSGEVVQVRADSRLLRRMIRNLLENARRYGGGTAIDVGVHGDDTGIVLRVEDRGPGIPENERERVFEPFYRRAGTAESGHGVGLGLALVRQIAQRHGGEVRCLPRAGGGTCFEVVLPSG